jgi:DNA-binding NarL/FixJ family response regulator
MDLSPSTPLTTVLLIDDNDKDRTYYAKRIRMGIPDCMVLEARDGQSGLALYRSRKIDCILTEVYLPDMSGFELLIELVPRAIKPAVAVIILTRTVSKPLNALAMQLGAQGFFVKRFTSGDELRQIIPRTIARIGPDEKTRQQDDQIS